MGWLLGYTIASMIGAFLVVPIFDYVAAGVTGGLGNTARLGLFVSTWTAITTGSGMRDFTDRVRQLRQKIK